MEFEYIKITNDEYSCGYFFHLANSRSGHNFIKKNIQSWTNDINANIRKFTNLENANVKEIHDTLLKDGNLHKYPDSIYVMNIRNLLNWYSSSIYFHTNQFKFGDANNKRSEYYKDKIIIHQSEFDKNPKLTLSNPHLIIIPDDESKSDYRKRKTSLNHSIHKYLPTILDKWLVIAKEFLNKTNYLPQFIRIYYDDFFVSRKYREEICNKIGGIYNETHLNNVTRAGGFSSFDGNSYQDRGQEMNVLYRWKQVEPEYLKYLKILKEQPALEFYMKNFDISIEEKNFIDSI